MSALSPWLDRLALRLLRHPLHHIPGAMAFARWRADTP